MSENRAKSKKKPRGKPFTGADDPRRGKGGRPRDEHSVTYWMQYFGAMSPMQVAQQCAIYARELKQGGDDLPIFAIIAIRALMSLMNESDARLFTAALNRLEGPVVQRVEIDDWRIIAKQQGYDPDRLFADMVNAARARLVESSNGGGVSNSTSTASHAIIDESAADRSVDSGNGNH